MIAGRRKILQMLGIGAVSVPSLPLALPAALSNAKLATAMAGSVASDLGGPTVQAFSPGVRRLGQALFEHLEILNSANQAADNVRRMARSCYGGVDPDIAAMKSWSAATKLRKQIERDVEAAAVDNKIYKLLYH